MPEDLGAWVGSREEIEDLIAPWPAEALHAVLGLEGPAPRAGDPLPPLWHWLYFLPAVPQAGLGNDGHPARGGFLPPVPLPRRMFAGGRYQFLQPLRIGEAARSIGEVKAVTEKRGSAGPLVFVLLRYEIAGDSGLSIVAEHDIVYRDVSPDTPAPEPEAAAVPAAAWSRAVTPDPVLLFRYSALTFNAHRIHYDHPYVTATEGYPGLVVHGPLTAMLLADLARRNDPRPIRTFSFRARAPLFAGNTVTLLGRPGGATAELEAWSHDYRRTMTAEAGFERNA